MQRDRPALVWIARRRQHVEVHSAHWTCSPEQQQERCSAPRRRRHTIGRVVRALSSVLASYQLAWPLASADPLQELRTTTRHLQESLFASEYRIELHRTRDGTGSQCASSGSAAWFSSVSKCAGSGSRIRSLYMARSPWPIRIRLKLSSFGSGGMPPLPPPAADAKASVPSTMGSPSCTGLSHLRPAEAGSLPIMTASAKQ
jgi:hypothetical protein